MLATKSINALIMNNELPCRAGWCQKMKTVRYIFIQNIAAKYHCIHF